MDFLEGLTYEHVDFIFSDPIYPQESVNSTINTYAYKFGYSEPETFSYYDNYDAYAINDHTMWGNEFPREFDVSSTMVNESTINEHGQQYVQSTSSFRTNLTECESNHNVIWEDNLDPDNMTYEELVELGEIVGNQSRGLSQETASLLPVSKFKCGFLRKKSRDERCVICQMEYERGDHLITLPCKHIYHADCGSQWLSINKACPICYKEVHHVHVFENTKKSFANAVKKGRRLASNIFSHLKSIF